MKLLIICLFSILIFSCNSENENCADKICTEEFRSVSIKFLDSKGKPSNVKDYKVYNQTTKQFIVNYSVTDSVNAKGYYLIVNDLNKNDLSIEGDQIIISAKNPVDNSLRQAEYKISGGKCSCHISKISGPETIQF